MSDITTYEGVQKVTAGAAGKKSSAELVQLVVFTLDTEEYAVPITDLQEIIKVPEITPIPNSPRFIKGILNLRGKIVVVIDLEKRFQLAREVEKELKHIIITEINGASFGVVVDEVIEVLTVSKEVIQPTPSLVSSKIHSDYLNGVVVLQKDCSKNDPEKKNADGGGEGSTEESRLLILINLSKILQEKDLAEAGEIVGGAITNIEEVSKTL